MIGHNILYIHQKNSHLIGHCGCTIHPTTPHLVELLWYTPAPFALFKCILCILVYFILSLVYVLSSVFSLAQLLLSL